MSSLLRSTKFMRYFAGAARTLLLNTPKTAEVSFAAVATKPLSIANNIFLREYVTSKKSESLEPLLQKLDSEVKRFGRVSLKDIDEVFNEIKAKNDITSSQSLLVIRCCGELVPEEPPEQRTLLVQRIWAVLTEIGVPMDISHYNALLRVYIENEHPFSPAAFLEELEKKGLEPNRVTYQRLMWRYCQEGDVEGATKVLEKMRELGMPVSEPVLNALVMGHAFLGDTDGAKAVLETMAGAGLQPSDRTYTLLACGYAKKADSAGVLDCIKMAVDKDIFLSNKDILDIIEAYAGNADTHKNIEDLIELLKPNALGYNQDCCNAILRLINKGHIEVAKEIMKTMTSRPNYQPTIYHGSFFIKQLLKVINEPKKLLEVCKDLQREGLVSNPLYIAAEHALQSGKSEIAVELFKELKKSGIEIRPHYYWPLLAKKGKENDEEGMLRLLTEMSSEGVDPTSETLRDFVIPYIKQKDGQTLVTKLQIAGIPTIQAARCVMVFLLETGKIQEAANIALQYRPYGLIGFTSRPLVASLSKTKDVKSFLTILHVISTKFNASSADAESVEDGNSDDKQLFYEMDPVIKSAIRILSNPELCEKLLCGLLDKGISIRTSTAEYIEQYLGENLTSNISEILTKLSSNGLERAPIEFIRRTSTGARSANQLEKQLDKVSSQSSNNTGIQRQLLQAYIRENNLEKVTNFVEKLKSENVEFSLSSLAQLFEFYSIHNEVEKALEIKKEIEEKNPDFALNTYKLFEFMYALVRSNKFEDAIHFVENNKPNTTEDMVFQTNSKCFQMLNYLAESTKEGEKVLQLTKLLIEKEYVEPSNVLLGPSIKAHLLSNDIDGALKVFEFCCNQYRCTPWKGELMKALILKEDANKLQWLADLSTQIHGEVNILHDLVLAFVECGRLRQARKILETPGLYTKQKRLDDACQRYVQDGKAEYLEGLLEATKELSYIDRSNIFYHLLVTYCKADETNKALSLWTLLQEDGEVPSTQFLLCLGKHLKEKGVNVPFVMPEDTTQIKANNKKSNQQKTPRANPNVAKEISNEIEKLVDSGKYREATALILEAFKKGAEPRRSIIKYVLKKLAEDGDVSSIKLLEPIMTEELRKGVAYDDKLIQAIFVNGSAAKHMEQLHQKVLQAKDNQLKDLLLEFPRSNALMVVINEKDVIDKCREIAEIAGSKGIYAPANFLWMEYLISGNTAAADELWNKHLINSEQILFKRILQHAFKNNNTQLIEKVLRHIETNTNITKAARGIVYSRLISTHAAAKDFDKAKAALDEAISKGITLEQIGRTTLKGLKSAIEEAGGEFQHDFLK